MFEYAKSTLKKLFQRHPTLSSNFTSSIYPAVTFNCGPTTSCRKHVDHGNAANLLCAITPLGTFDPTRGGHLIIYPLRRFYQFPPGSTILIPSSLVAHGNTPTMPGETRFSVTQYCSGGLLRWVEYGFCSIKTLLAQPGGAERKREIDGAPGSRWVWALSLFSTLDELLRDDAGASTIV